MENKRVVLGSGKLYIIEFSGEIPENSMIEVPENILGYIQKGANIEYKPEYYTAEDDLGLIKEIFLTKETVTFKSGVMTWNGKTLQKLCSTAIITENAEKKTRTVKIGGVGKQDGKMYAIRFVYENKVSGNIRTTIVGKNENGFAITFEKEKETVIDATFTATPIDDDGTLLIYEEEFKEETI